MSLANCRKLMETISLDDLGGRVISAVWEPDNYAYDIGRSITRVVDACNSESEYDFANKMCIAITGYSLETLIDDIKEEKL